MERMLQQTEPLDAKKLVCIWDWQPIIAAISEGASFNPPVPQEALWGIVDYPLTSPWAFSLLPQDKKDVGSLLQAFAEVLTFMYQEPDRYKARRYDLSELRAATIFYDKDRQALILGAES